MANLESLLHDFERNLKINDSKEDVSSKLYTYVDSPEKLSKMMDAIGKLPAGIYNSHFPWSDLSSDIFC